MKILVLDGQGGKIGGYLAEALRREVPDAHIIALGTNSIATSMMLKNGAHAGATGENPVIVNCKNADIIAGPMGITVANSLLGEITPKMAVAIGESPALKVLVPINRCNTIIAGTQDLPISDYIKLALQQIKLSAAASKTK